eukprot:TRINITY_DN654_c1_g1_i4.p1 TRINITY_DN654_c1_g1~~TRINITY_DN654_c1_g1_i4.p1  ORF type:complete len:201 (+),score=12.78 TRINITY_DN654_c1_g1_i4:117-719(+)
MYYADVFLVTSDDRSFTLSGTTRTNFAEDGKAAFKMLRSTALSSKYGASKFRLRFEVQKDDGLNLNPILLISSEFPIVAKVPKDSKLILEKLVPNKVPSDVSTEVAILGYFPTSPNAVLEVRLCQDGEDVESSQSIRYVCLLQLQFVWNDGIFCFPHCGHSSLLRHQYGYIVYYTCIVDTTLISMLVLCIRCDRGLKSRS